MSIPFTQYLRPGGQQTQIKIDLSPEVEAKARKIIEAGFKFEAEILRTGHCSFTIVDPERELDADIIICENGPAVPEKISEMILRFDSEAYPK